MHTVAGVPGIGGGMLYYGGPVHRCLAQRDTVAVSKHRSKGAKQIPYKLQERSHLDPVKRGQFQHSTRGRTQMSCKLQGRPRPSHPGGPAKRGKYHEILHGAAAGGPVAARSHYGRPRAPHLDFITLEQTGGHLLPGAPGHMLQQLLALYPRSRPKRGVQTTLSWSLRALSCHVLLLGVGTC